MFTTWVQIAVVLLFALTCAALVVAWMRGRLGAAAIGLLAIACLAWLAAFAAIVSGYHGADRFVDCTDQCSGIQYFSAIGFLTPPLLISLSALGMIVALGQRWRLRRRPIDENHA